MFGIADAAELRLVKPVARALIARDALRADDFGGLSFGPAARPILKGEESVPLVLPPARSGKGRGPREEHPHDPLFEALRAVRRDLAKERGVPPYVVFHDSTLREMAAFRPRDMHALGQITGVGQAKREAYGDAFISAIRNWKDEA